VANYCQIFQDTIVVSGRAEIVKKAGMKSAMAYHKAKAYKELQRDMEAGLAFAEPRCGGRGWRGSEGGRPGRADLHERCTTARAHHGCHTSGAPTTANTAGTNRAFTEALLKSAAQTTFNAWAKCPR
jgi:hypothetical protein